MVVLPTHGTLNFGNINPTAGNAPRNVARNTTPRVRIPNPSWTDPSYTPDRSRACSSLETSSYSSTHSSSPSLNEHVSDTSTAYRQYHQGWNRLNVDPELGSTPSFRVQPRKRWHFWDLFGDSKLQRKADNPTSCDAINYDPRRKVALAIFLRLLLFSIYCMCISLFYPWLGLECAIIPENAAQVPEYNTPLPACGTLCAIRILAVAGTFYIIAQGSANIRVARDRMERITHCCITVAFSFLKTINPAQPEHRDDQQRMVYECMALVTAFPVATIQRLRGNTCELAVARYCREAAERLKKIRDGKEILYNQTTAPEFYAARNEMGGFNKYFVVDHFFETFSLQLEMEYKTIKWRTKSKPLTTAHITHCLRNHYENLLDLGSVDDRRGASVREGIEMMGAIARELCVHTPRESRARVFLAAITITGWILIAHIPIDRCNLLVNSSVASAVIPTQPEYPTLLTLRSILFMVVTCTLLLTILDEARAHLDPFRRGFNTYAWTLGIAIELDAMLNSFYETEPAAMIRKHSYMPSRSDSEKGMAKRYIGQPERILPAKRIYRNGRERAPSV